MYVVDSRLSGFVGRRKQLEELVSPFISREFITVIPLLADNVIFSRVDFGHTSKIEFNVARGIELVGGLKYIVGSCKVIGQWARTY